MSEDEAVDRCCGGACDAVPVLHSRPYQCGSAAWSDGRGNHGSHLGRRGNARGGAYAYSALALDAIAHIQAEKER